MARIYGPAGTRGRGGTVAFNLLDPGGHVVDERAVARATAAAGISIRTGCFCNPGASEGAFKLTLADWRRALRGRARTLDQYIDLLGLPSGGALRASVGLASNIDDVERFLAFVELTYRDRTADTGGLAPRQSCLPAPELMMDDGPGSARRLLGVFAHPDDEVFCAGGTMARAAEAGAEVMIVSASRGERGQIRDATAAARRTLGAVREGEVSPPMRCT
jgi:hypothetical protein